MRRLNRQLELSTCVAWGEGRKRRRGGWPAWAGGARWRQRRPAPPLASISNPTQPPSCPAPPRAPTQHPRARWRRRCSGPAPPWRHGTAHPACAPVTGRRGRQRESARDRAGDRAGSSDREGWGRCCSAGGCRTTFAVGPTPGPLCQGAPPTAKPPPVLPFCSQTTPPTAHRAPPPCAPPRLTPPPTCASASRPVGPPAAPPPPAPPPHLRLCVAVLLLPLRQQLPHRVRLLLQAQQLVGQRARLGGVAVAQPLQRRLDNALQGGRRRVRRRLEGVGGLFPARPAGAAGALRRLPSEGQTYVWPAPPPPPAPPTTNCVAGGPEGRGLTIPAAFFSDSSTSKTRFGRGRALEADTRGGAMSGLAVGRAGRGAARLPELEIKRNGFRRAGRPSKARRTKLGLSAGLCHSPRRPPWLLRSTEAARDAIGRRGGVQANCRLLQPAGGGSRHEQAHSAQLPGQS